ncbi:MAG: serine hydrolase domain-containing protein [Candidatus Lernaella stagnicola]|nr:serine hydrolase domain-containing protein [Candidatus Lernaella stagnicola]
MNEPAAILERAVEQKDIPGAVLRVERAGRLVHESAHGVTRYDTPHPVRLDTWFDLASLTKILATTPVAMRLFDRGDLDLDAPLHDFLPDVAEDFGRQPFYRFLHHTSGARPSGSYHRLMPPELVATAGGKTWTKSQLAEERPAYEPGTRQVYSDIGFALAGWALERLSGASLDDLFQREVAGPLRITDLLFLQVTPRSVDSIAATQDCPWRGRVVCGVVHDYDTYAAGGALGQAGLFGTAAAVARVVEEFRLALQGESDWLSNSAMTAFLNNADHLPGVDYRLGFDTVSAVGSTAGDHFSRDTFGHLGFTGVSAWCDPKAELTVVLLTNRLHPSIENLAIRTLRPAVHNAVWKELFDG